MTRGRALRTDIGVAVEDADACGQEKTSNSVTTINMLPYLIALYHLPNQNEQIARTVPIR